MNDISVAAGVAIRTIYLHFDSKAAVLLAYFEDWLSELVQHIAEQPGGQGPDTVLEKALSCMVESGWRDNRTFDGMRVPPPVVVFIGDGSPEIAGHVMHLWVRAQDQLTEHFRKRDDLGPESLTPRIEAAAVFATWMATILTYRDQFAGRLATTATSHEIAVTAMRRYTAGLDT